mmetsp:Transcript_31284/g.98009  ORF Transcript_31284/g.98009 Transcript_31284/m.98009 type:complete len:269 (+) Transcript_31284:2711-3517(+)
MLPARSLMSLRLSAASCGREPTSVSIAVTLSGSRGSPSSITLLIARSSAGCCSGLPSGEPAGRCPSGSLELSTSYSPGAFALGLGAIASSRRTRMSRMSAATFSAGAIEGGLCNAPMTSPAEDSFDILWLFPSSPRFALYFFSPTANGRTRPDIYLTPRRPRPPPCPRPRRRAPARPRPPRPPCRCPPAARPAAPPSSHPRTRPPPRRTPGPPPAASYGSGTAPSSPSRRASAAAPYRRAPRRRRQLPFRTSAPSSPPRAQAWSTSCG